MKRTSAPPAGEHSPEPARPVHIVMTGEMIMIERNGVRVLVGMQNADSRQPSNSCIGCNCIVTIEPCN